MKKRINYFLKKFKWTVMAVLGVLGITNCSFWGACEYGTPYAEYKVSGKVLTEDNIPIEGIKTTISSGFSNNNNISWGGFKDSFSDKKGNFIQETEAFSSPNDDTFIKIVYEDIDGQEGGGLFSKDSLIIKSTDFTQTEKPSGNWYQGKYSVSKDFKLKKSEQ
jgi:putative lipoprotein (rSAM/lipoprotein system)